ncbi:MAG: GTP cyclohydrolase II [Anaerolineales bacterium]
MHEKFDVLLDQKDGHPYEELGRDEMNVRVAAMAELPTRFGQFHIVAFENNRDGKEHIAITRGDVIGASDVPVRLHSECLTGDVMGSLRCDCRDQLEAALKKISELQRGVVLYLRQEGRGIGLVNKIRAYSLQDQGLDTVEANLALGFRDDERDYAVAAHMLMALKIESVQLMTNNPKKIDQLTRYGVKVNDRIPHIMEPNQHNRFYLETKAAKSGHMIELTGRERLNRPSVSLL